MRWQTLDSIVRSALLQRGYPIHWYVDFLKFASDGLRELHFDTLKSISSAKIPVNSYKAFALPCDYVDWVEVGTPVGEYVRPMTQESGMNRLNNFDTLGNKVPYGNDYPSTLAVEVYVNNDLNLYGEHTGGIFNHNAGRTGLNFRELRERDEIQLNSDYPYDYVILNYISDGQSGDAATQVHPYAQAAIEAYIGWKMKANNRTMMPEVNQAYTEYVSAARVLRARLSELTPDEIIHAVRKGYSGTYKN